MSVSQHLESSHASQSSGTGVPHRTERRRSKRDAVHGEPSRSRLVALVLGTYGEMPGLSLYPRQAARLFGLREATCLVVLADLVRDGSLRQSSDGQYRTANSGVI
jgi:hypothetical protein